MFIEITSMVIAIEPMTNILFWLFWIVVPSIMLPSSQDVVVFPAVVVVVVVVAAAAAFVPFFLFELLLIRTGNIICGTFGPSNVPCF